MLIFQSSKVCLIPDWACYFRAFKSYGLPKMRTTFFWKKSSFRFAARPLSCLIRFASTPDDAHTVRSVSGSLLPLVAEPGPGPHFQFFSVLFFPLWSFLFVSLFALDMDVALMIHQTGGNRSGLTGSGLDRYQTGSNSKFKFKFKKWKILKKFLKILQGAKNLMVSNFLKNSFI